MEGEGVVVVVRTMVYDDHVYPESSMHASSSGGRTLGSQTPGVPATPEPSMTKNSSSSRAHLALSAKSGL